MILVCEIRLSDLPGMNVAMRKRIELIGDRWMDRKWLLKDGVFNVHGVQLLGQGSATVLQFVSALFCNLDRSPIVPDQHQRPAKVVRKLAADVSVDYEDIDAFRHRRREILIQYRFYGGKML